MKTILYWLVVLIAGIAVYGTFGLVANEWELGDICPKILGVPACYIVLVCFAVALLSHLIPFKSANSIYFLFVGIVTAIAITGTLGELTGTAECPKTAGGTPMCFISLAICLGLLFSKIGWLRVSA